MTWNFPPEYLFEIFKLLAKKYMEFISLIPIHQLSEVYKYLDENSITLEILEYKMYPFLIPLFLSPLKWKMKLLAKFLLKIYIKVLKYFIFNTHKNNV